MSLEEKVEDITRALNCCSSENSGILIGGDFNLHYNSPEFRELENCLDSYDVVLASDPDIVTFINTRGKSTPDHIFVTRSLNVVNFEVVNRCESSHLPLKINITVPRGTLETRRTETKYELNYTMCNELLERRKPLIESQSPAEIEETLRSSISQSLALKRERKKKIPWDTKELRRLRTQTNKALKLYQQSRNISDHEKFALCRRTYQSKVKKERQKFSEIRTATLIGDAQNMGIRAIYRYNRPENKNTSAFISLTEWKTYCSKLYQSLDKPKLQLKSGAPTQAASLLSVPFTAFEVSRAISSFTSKARGRDSISPFDLKNISENATEYLVPIFNSILKFYSHDEPALTFLTEWMKTVLFFSP